MAAHQQKVLSIKVKAGTQGGMKSLWLFMREKNLTEAVRCSLENFGSFEYKDQGTKVPPDKYGFVRCMRWRGWGEPTRISYEFD